MTAALEKRGTPTVALITHPFVNFARRMAFMVGCPYISIIPTPEPIQGLGADQLYRRAETMIAAVIEGLTLPPDELERRLKDVARQQIRPEGIVRSSVPV